MVEFVAESFWDLMMRGGKVMWPLLALSVIGLGLVLERCWFWIRTNRPRELARVREMGRLLRRGESERARELAKQDRTVYGQAVLRLLEEPYSEALAIEAVESQRRELERFMPTLSTIITAAPMLGILGTVTGIIASFNILGQAGVVATPEKVSAGIAEALLTTVAGLVIAIAVLFPYNAFRAQIEWTVARIESLAAAAAHARSSAWGGTSRDPVPPTAEGSQHRGG